MADKNKNNYLWIGIAVVVVIVFAIVFINSNQPKTYVPNCNYPERNIGDSCCIDKNYNDICDNQEKVSFNVNDIQVSMEGDRNVDLYLNGEGGPFSKSNFIEITNNNPGRLCFRIYCESLINTVDGACWPDYSTATQNSDSNFCIEGNSKDTQEIRMGVHIIPETTIGSYSGNIKIDLVKYWNDINSDWIYSSQNIKAFPITINAHCKQGFKSGDTSYCDLS